MLFLFTISMFLISAFYLSYFAKSSFLSSFINIIIVNVIISYLLSIFEIIHLYRYIFYIEIILLLPVSYIFYKNFQITKVKEILLKPSNLIFILFFVYVLYINQNRYFHLWDEIVHWGYSAKYLFTQKHIYLNYSGLTGTTYPPATALLSYIFNLFSTTFSEENYYYAALLLPLAMFSDLLDSLKWKHGLLALVGMLGLLYIPSVLFEHFLSSVYVDGLLSIVFAYSLIKVINFDYDKTLNYIELALILVFFVLVKNTGYQFSMIVIGTLLLKYIFIHLKQLDYRKILGIVSLFIFVFIVNKSWNVYTSLQIVENASHVSLSIFTLDTLNNIFNLSFAETYKNAVIQNFINLYTSFDYPTFFIQIPYILWPIFIIIGTILIIRKQHQSKINLIIVFMISLAFYAYSFYLLIYYLFYFSEYEATILASADRYLNTYLGMLIILVWYLFIRFLSQKKRKYLNFLFAILLIIQTTFWFYPLTIALRSNAQLSQATRTGYAQIESFNSVLKPDDKVVFVAQETSGDYSNYARYLWLPNTIAGNFSFGPTYTSYDQWSVDLDLNEMEAYLKDYQYIYLFKIDKQFTELYYYLFDNPNDIKDGQAYQINLYDNNQHVSLVKVYP